MLIFRMSGHRFRGMQHLLLLNRSSACLFFSMLIWKQIFCCFSGLVFCGVRTRAWMYMWSFSLQAEMILTVAHLWDLWVWWRSRFSESINRWRGVLEREAEIWAESAWLMLSGKASAAEDQQPVCVRCLPLQCHPIRRKVSLERRNLFLRFPSDIQYWVYLLCLNWKFHHLFHSSDFTLPFSFLT